MSVATPAALAGRTGSGPVLDRPAVRGARLALRSQLVVWGWFWLTLVVIAVGILVVTVRVSDVGHSVWDYLSAAPRWFTFTLLVLLVTAGVGPYVAHGLTRRAFVRLDAVVAVVTAVAFAACWTLGQAVEVAVFRAQGWPTVVQRADHLYTDGAQLGLVALEALGTLLVYAAAGVLVGAVYYRAGGWWGTLTLPLTLAPLALAQVLVAGRVGEGVVGVAADLPTAVRLLGLLVLAPAALAVAHVVLGRAAVRRPAS